MIVVLFLTQRHRGLKWKTMENMYYRENVYESSLYVKPPYKNSLKTYILPLSIKKKKRTFDTPGVHDTFVSEEKIKN